MDIARDLFKTLRGLLAGPGVPELGPGPRLGVTSLDVLEPRLDAVLAGTQAEASPRRLARALVLLWHDHLDAAHRIAQQIETADGSYVHAIVHRREPDCWNSKYWFRHVGRHDCFAELARQASALLQSKGETGLQSRLAPGGAWDALAFVDACKAAASRPTSDPQQEVLRAIQAMEFDLLLKRSCRE